MGAGGYDLEVGTESNKMGVERWEVGAYSSDVGAKRWDSKLLVVRCVCQIISRIMTR